MLAIKCIMVQGPVYNEKSMANYTRCSSIWENHVYLNNFLIPIVASGWLGS